MQVASRVEEKEIRCELSVLALQDEMITLPFEKFTFQRLSHPWSQLWQMECLPKILQSNLDWPQKQPLSSSKSNFSLISKLFSQNTVAWKYLQNSLGQKSKPCFLAQPRFSNRVSPALCLLHTCEPKSKFKFKPLIWTALNPNVHFFSFCCHWNFQISLLHSAILTFAECAIYKHVHNSNMLVYCCCVMFANKPYAYFILHYVLLCIIYVTNYISHFQDDCTYCNMDCMRYLQMQYTHLAYTLCILWDCCTNCNQLGSVWSQSLLLKHCQHIAHIFQANVLPMFRMQYFCNNVIFATPICNTFLSNKDIWSRIRF